MVNNAAMNDINLITGNANKIADIKATLAPAGITVHSQSLDIPEIQGSIEEITIAKCRRAAEMVRLLSNSIIWIWANELTGWRSGCRR